jgi:hypothetical protein
LTAFCRRRYHELTYSRNEVRFRQIFGMISKVSPNICEKSCQKFLTISIFLCSTLLSFCQIRVTITKIARFHTYLAQFHTDLAGFVRNIWLVPSRKAHGLQQNIKVVEENAVEADVLTFKDLSLFVITPWAVHLLILKMVLDPSQRNDPVTTDGRSYILHQLAAGECERWHPPGRESPARERRRCMPAKSAGYSAAPQHLARRPARRPARGPARGPVLA